MKGLQNPTGGDIWVVGFGNRNRRDDGSGPYAADQLKACLGDTAGVHVISLHQLVPELADELKSASCVYFIDAAQGFLPGNCLWRRIRPVMEMQTPAHSLSPEALLGLTRLIFNRCPPAWMITIQGSDFGFGEGLSTVAEEGANCAVQEVVRALQRGNSTRHRLRHKGKHLFTKSGIPIRSDS